MQRLKGISDRTKEVPKLAELIYVHTLVIGSTQVGTIWLMDLVFMSTFNDQSMDIGSIG